MHLENVQRDIDIILVFTYAKLTPYTLQFDFKLKTMRR